MIPPRKVAGRSVRQVRQRTRSESGADVEQPVRPGKCPLDRAAPPSATNKPAFAFAADCQLPLVDEIAHAAAEMVSIRQANISP